MAPGDIEGPVNLPLAKALVRLTASDLMGEKSQSVACVGPPDKRSAEAAAAVVPAGHCDVGVLRGRMNLSDLTITLRQATNIRLLSWWRP